MLTKHESLSVSEIESYLKSEDESYTDLEVILNQLIQESLVERYYSNRYRIPE